MLQLPQFSYKDQSLSDVLVDLAVRFVLNCPPEDVSTAERLFFQVEEAHWFYEDFARVDNPSLPSLRIRQFAESLYQACSALKELNSDPVSALLEFQNYKRLIPVRGAILINEKLDKVLMVRAWKSTSWGFPRGKINKNESDEKCAVREVLEETGYDISDRIRSEDYLEVVRNGKNFRLYIVRGIPQSTVFETQTRKEISKIDWHKIKSLPGSSGHHKSKSRYFMTTPFVAGIEKYVAKAKGLASSLSTTESDALKNLLGIKPGLDMSRTLRTDEEGAKKFLELLHPTSAPAPVTPPTTTPLEAAPAANTADTAAVTPLSDRQVLLDLLKSGKKTSDEQKPTHDLESAQQILGLLQGEMSAEEQVTKVIPPQVAPPPKPQKGAQQPPVPPPSMLQSLVSSRKSQSGHAMNSSGLMGLLKPKPSQGLMSLLQDPSTSVTNPPSMSSSSQKESDVHISPSKSLLGLLSNEATKSSTSDNENMPSYKGDASSALLGLLQAESTEHGRSNEPDEPDEPKVEPMRPQDNSTTTSVSPSAEKNAENKHLVNEDASASLLSLLHSTQKSGETSARDSTVGSSVTAPPDKENKTASLLGLLQEEEHPESKDEAEKQKPVKASSSLLNLLTPEQEINSQVKTDPPAESESGSKSEQQKPKDSPKPLGNTLLGLLRLQSPSATESGSQDPIGRSTDSEGRQGASTARSTLLGLLGNENPTSRFSESIHSPEKPEGSSGTESSTASETGSNEKPTEKSRKDIKQKGQTRGKKTSKETSEKPESTQRPSSTKVRDNGKRADSEQVQQAAQEISLLKLFEQRNANVLNSNGKPETQSASTSSRPTTTPPTETWYPRDEDIIAYLHRRLSI